MTAPFHLDVIAQSFSLQVVDCLVQGTLIAVVGVLMLGMARRQNSGTRFAIWFSALMAIAALPLFGSLFGRWWSHAMVHAMTPSTQAPPAITMPGSWALYIFGTWAAIAGLFLAGVVRGLSHLHVLRKSCVPVDPAFLDAKLQKTLAGNAAVRPAALCTSSLVHVPTVIGLLNPLIVIPGWAMQELSPDELHQILLHELAHLRRWDDWTNLVQKIVKALFFFHPAVWWLEKRASLEREMACDDAVLAETASPRAYAECLAHLAEKTMIQRSVALAQAALGRIRQTSLRVAQILDVNRPTAAGRRWKSAASFMAAIALAFVLCVGRTPRLVAFGNDGTSRFSASTVNSDPSAFASESVSTAAPISGVNIPKLESQRYPVRLLQAGFKVRGSRSVLASSAHAVFSHAPISERPSASSVRPAQLRHSIASRSNAGQTNAGQTNARPASARLASASSDPVTFTETLFVIVEGGNKGFPDEPVFQIQMWRVMVLHPVADPNSNKIPPKQT
jgi:beta-lactamase regulating signal transducer with metallopeptidase domain